MARRVSGCPAGEACALLDWLAEPALEPIGARIVVRRAAGRRGGPGGQAVALETPGEFLGGGFMGSCGSGARALLSPGQGAEWWRARGRSRCGRRGLRSSPSVTVGETEAGEWERRGRVSWMPFGPFHKLLPLASSA